MPTPAALKLIENFSLEMTGKDVDALREAAPAIPAGTKINVTFLGNEDLEMRVNAAKAVKELGFTPVPHISARRIASEAQLREFLAALQQVGATEHVFAVGGDPATPEGPYPDSLSLIRSGVLSEYGVKEVSVAGYPEGTPVISEEDLWYHLEEKTKALTEQGLGQVVLTQFAFDAERVAAWVADVRAHGVEAPIRIGTPGPAGIKRLLNYARRFGVGSSAGIVKKYGFSLTNLMGTAGPDKFVNALSELLQQDPRSGEVGTHFYTFGGMKATAEWANKFITGA
jgi:methylenetetrahydrofolate reductase (NADPH)